MEVDGENATTSNENQDLFLFISHDDCVLRGFQPLKCGADPVQEDIEDIQVLVLQPCVFSEAVGHKGLVLAVAIPRSRQIDGVDHSELRSHPGHAGVGSHGGTDQLGHLEQLQTSNHQVVVLHHTHVAPVLLQDLCSEGFSDAHAVAAELGASMQIHLLVVDLFGFSCNEGPVELVQCLLFGNGSHPPGMLEILANLAAAPSDAAGIGIH
mmetsp:Transcript_32096/g.69313  ORF Transcript_32096/g.69313 Transcript_32096/m.69313 type:complete len:210 (-) Transcript_32096:4904-5533(-)